MGAVESLFGGCVCPTANLDDPSEMDPVKDYNCCSYSCEATCPTWCLPSFDCCLNEFLFIVNGCYKTEPKPKNTLDDPSEYYTRKDNHKEKCCGVIKARPRPSNVFRGKVPAKRPCCDSCLTALIDFGPKIFDCIVGCLYCIDGRPPVAKPSNPNGKLGVIRNYEELERIAENGDLILSGCDSGFGQIIEGLTNSNLNHTAVVIDKVGNGHKKDLMVHQATIWDSLNGVGGRSFKYIMTKNYAPSKSWMFICKLNAEMRKQFASQKKHVDEFLRDASTIKICGKISNRRYDMANCARMRYALKQIRKGNGQKSRDLAKYYIQTNNHFYGNCSEFTAGVYKASGVLHRDVNCSYVSPESASWPNIFDGYYQVVLKPAMLDDEHSKYMNYFGCVDREDYTKVVENFYITPPTWALNKNLGKKGDVGVDEVKIKEDGLVLKDGAKYVTDIQT